MGRKLISEWVLQNVLIVLISVGGPANIWRSYHLSSWTDVALQDYTKFVFRSPSYLSHWTLVYIGDSKPVSTHPLPLQILQSLLTFQRGRKRTIRSKTGRPFPLPFLVAIEQPILQEDYSRILLQRPKHRLPVVLQSLYYRHPPAPGDDMVTCRWFHSRKILIFWMKNACPVHSSNLRLPVHHVGVIIPNIRPALGQMSQPGSRSAKTMSQKGNMP
jgi:hypothetical protein